MSVIHESPLVHALSARHGMPVLDTLVTAPPGLTVVFLPSHARPHLETPDIAAVLPDLLRAAQTLLPPDTPLRGAVADAALEAELCGRIDGLNLPALVLLHDGVPTGMIPRMRDWDEYGRLFRGILSPYCNAGQKDVSA
ncbi:hypothetical protein JCM25156A_28000 [Komagataeibacter kakiaceti JCM 25156]